MPLGDGLLGAVAATGEPRRGRVEPGRAVRRRASRAASRTWPCRSPRPGVGPHAPGCEPRVGPAARPARGVLALYDRLGFDEFDDSDLVTLRTFAGQAAVAVDNVRVHEEAQRLSLTDPLTGLCNYRYLRESLRREVERASRFGRRLGVLALDLDRFKEVNDTYGHAAGDAVLAEFARRVRAEIREVDFAFRQGGEEFVVLLPETDAPRRARSSPSGSARRSGDTPVAGDSATPGPAPRPHPGDRLDRHRRLSRPRRDRRSGARRRRRRAVRGEGGRPGHVPDGVAGDRSAPVPRRGAAGAASEPDGSPDGRRPRRRRARRSRGTTTARQQPRPAQPPRHAWPTSRDMSAPANPSAPPRRSRAVKAVIPAAGLATRFLPATKAVPKELLPVVDRPVLQYIVEEAAAAGIDDVLLVTGRGKT